MSRKNRKAIQVGKIRTRALISHTRDCAQVLFKDEVALAASEISLNPFLVAKGRMLRAVLSVQAESQSDILVCLTDKRDQDGNIIEPGFSDMHVELIVY